MLSSDAQYMLVLEDDVDAVSSDVRTALADLLRRGVLPTHWQFCLLGSHEHSRLVKSSGARVVVNEVKRNVTMTGGFAYLVNKAGAARLDKGIFPLTKQWDALVADLDWGEMTRFAVGPLVQGGPISAPLFSAPRSEEGNCDSDVQHFGTTDKDAHASLPPDMAMHAFRGDGRPSAPKRARQELRR